MYNLNENEYLKIKRTILSFSISILKFIIIFSGGMPGLQNIMKQLQQGAAGGPLMMWM